MKRALYGLGEYLQLLQKHHLVTEYHITPGMMDEPVSLVSCDSREVVPGTLFICKGAHFRPEYLAQALKAGAMGYISAQRYDHVGGGSYFIVSDVRRAMALLANMYYQMPWKRLNLIGITGTKGKSSTTYYVKYILDEYLAKRGKPRSAVISSIDTYDGVLDYESHITTPEPLELQRHFAHAADSGIEYLTMEVSSQGLKYDRVLGVHFDVACFLNIDEDHISPVEHPDLEDYFQSKLKLLAQCSVGCVNLDSDRAEEVLAAVQTAPRVITFSAKNPDASVYGSQIRKSGNDILFRVKTPRFSRGFRLTMPGLFNVENALAAIAICEGLGIPEEAIYVGLMKARVPGRMEIYTNANNKVIVIVDYAHNRLSFEQLFLSVQEEYPQRQVVTVFGCPGKKALERRRDLGEISGRYSQKVILTEEDAGEERVEDICREIAQYVEAQGCDYSIIPHRGEAIEAAIMGCEADSIILVTGKGAETRQKRGIDYIECPSDVEYTKEALHKYDVAHRLDGMEKVRYLVDVLPTLKQYEGKTVLLKYGGNALQGTGDTRLGDIAILRMAGARVVVVHGGGKQIDDLLHRLNIEPRIRNGYRVTDLETMAAVEMVLSASVNKEIVRVLQGMGVSAVGISGKDGGLLQAVQMEETLGRVGQITKVSCALLEGLLAAGFLPVISPVALGEDGGTFNVNADEAACAIAAALQVDKLVFLTDIDGILVDHKNQQTLITEMDVARAAELMESGLIDGGMVPKLKSCIYAIRNGVGKVVILDGRVTHSILLESISQKGLGTTITAQEKGAGTI